MSRNLIVENGLSVTAYAGPYNEGLKIQITMYNAEVMIVPGANTAYMSMSLDEFRTWLNHALMAIETLDILR